MIEQLKNITTLAGLEEFKSSMLAECENKKSEIILEGKATDISKKDFGYIKAAFESISSNLFESTKGRKLIKNYTDAIKENKSLSSLYSLYEGIRKTNKNADVDFFISEISSNDWALDKKEIKEGSEKLGQIMYSAYKLLGENCEKSLPLEENDLYKAIGFITENKKTVKNLSEYSNAVKVIRERIEKNDFNIESCKEISVDSLVKEFNEKYGNSLTEDEQKTLKDIFVAENKESVFNQYKEDCLKGINEAKEKSDSKTSDKLYNIHEQVSKKMFNEATFYNDIYNFIELNKIFD